MKTENSHRYIFFLLVLLLSAPFLKGQNKNQVEEEKRAQMEMEEAEKREAMRAEEMEKKKQMLYEQQEQMKALSEQYEVQAEELQNQSRNFNWNHNFDFNNGVAVGTPFIAPFPGQENQTQITLRKSFRETTGTSNGVFEVEKGIRHFRCMINGSVRNGEITVKIEYPDGKTFKELTINPSADINFSQSISVKEENEKKYVGTWNYEVKAKEAMGSYMVQIQTN